VLKKQLEVVKEEANRFDREEIEGHDNEFIDQVRVNRKRHRKNRGVNELESDSDIDEEFKLGMENAADRFGYKRKKKHMFTEQGVPIEPFNLKDDIKSGLLSKEGYLQRSL